MKLHNNKLALGIEYNGSRYYGWQCQKFVPSIQASLEEALSKIANHSIKTYCAGRTDAGVHSIGQVVHFETHALRDTSAWIKGVNRYLPHDITVRWVKNVDKDFHARFSARARLYRYIIYNYRSRPALFNTQVMHYYELLDVKLMHIAGQYLIGDNDYSSFRAANCQSRSSWKKIIYLNVTRHGSYVVINIKANSFLRHMVRNIVGCLIEVGCGKHNANWMAEILATKNRNHAKYPTVKSSGLYLAAVDYPKVFNLPYSQLELLFV
ncbi:MAG: tRNA pseudouridine(38-40) synthase TruA [Candidatus Dasytiphilus stammeri]